MWHGSFISVPLLKSKSSNNNCASRLMHMCAMARAYLCQHSSTKNRGQIITNKYVPWLICMRAMNHACSCRHTFKKYVTNRVHIIHERLCAMTVSYVWHGSCIFVPLLIQKISDESRANHPRTPMWDDSFTCVAWLIHMCTITWVQIIHEQLCDMIHSYVWHDSCILVPWLIHNMRDESKTHHPRTPVRNDSFTCVTWLIHTCTTTQIQIIRKYICAMTHSYVWHDSCIFVPWLKHNTRDKSKANHPRTLVYGSSHRSSYIIRGGGEKMVTYSQRNVQIHIYTYLYTLICLFMYHIYVHIYIKRGGGE